MSLMALMFMIAINVSDENVDDDPNVADNSDDDVVDDSDHNVVDNSDDNCVDDEYDIDDGYGGNGDNDMTARVV